MALPSTHWSLLDAVRDKPTAAHRDALNVLTERYYYPAYVHLRWRSVGHDEAQNLVQGFFEHCLQRELFGRADRARGRFRNFFLTALDNYVRNTIGKEQAQRRRPAGGFVPMDEELPAERDGVDRAFFRAFASRVVNELLREVEAECTRNDQGAHFLVFRRRVVEPALDGAEPPSEAALAHELGVTEKQVANYLVTVKRMFRRRMQAYVAEYAANEADVELEIKDLMGFFRWPE
jgi:RNA polymerase sigma-70 factor (ECF subfamily)